MAKDDLDRMNRGILGDIDPVPAARDRVRGSSHSDDEVSDPDAYEPLEGGSQHGESQHPGSRDVTEGVTGGTGTETGGTRNYRQGTGATGGDIGNRPE